MFIVLNEFGDAWTGVGWGWSDTQRFVTHGAAVRALQEAGEDVDHVSIVEDPFEVKGYANCA
jgi:hypothetical protein